MVPLPLTSPPSSSSLLPRFTSWDRSGGGHILIAALSGISTRGDVEKYEAAGVSTVLIGETLMRAADPTRAIQDLLGE